MQSQEQQEVALEDSLTVALITLTKDDTQDRLPHHGLTVQR